MFDPLFARRSPSSFSERKPRWERWGLEPHADLECGCIPWKPSYSGNMFFACLFVFGGIPEMSCTMLYLTNLFSRSMESEMNKIWGYLLFARYILIFFPFDVLEPGKKNLSDPMKIFQPRPIGSIFCQVRSKIGEVLDVDGLPQDDLRVTVMSSPRSLSSGVFFEICFESLTRGKWSNLTS